ncbi:ATP-binding protein [Pseudophaeobacter sp.]|uniref:PAS domain-containing hybrid sensor histidine kinase/response regulator n=1 Tax=Pseudophaeobacter sp. TaxID=1971739 RepID=UPI003296F8D6
MTTTGSSGQGPLAKHHERYGSEGLFLRYTRGQIRIFWPRMAFLVLVSLILWVVVSPQAGHIAFLVTATVELIDSLCLRSARRQILAGHPSARWRFLSTITAFVHGCGFAIGAAAPFWSEAFFGGGAQVQVDPIFTAGLLAGGAINAGLLFPYHKPASIARLTPFALAPIIVLASGVVDVQQMGFQLQLAGLLILYGALIWHVLFVIRSFARTRGFFLTQALQQQELEGAYQRLLKQQAEAKKLALVARHANDSVLIVDRDANIQWVNEAFTRLTGFRFEEALGQNPGILLNHSDTNPDAIREIEEGRRAEKPFRVEILNRHKDGSDIWFETNQVPIASGEGGAMSYIAIERDITAAKQAAQQLDEARLAAEEGNRAKSDFLATMSHEIRTPMNGVIGMAQLLEETDLDGDQKLYADTILSSARTLLALINDILDLSKLDAGQIELNPCDFDLHSCFDETTRLLQTQAENKGLDLVVERDSDLPRHLHGDDHRLRQILINLVGNAIKFTEKGRVKVSVEVEPAGAGDVMLHCSVVDTGIGIPKDMLKDIFERFSQADAAISRRFGGSGLGLAISRRLAEAMGGRITVSSELGAGSCFSLAMPFGIVGGGSETVEAAEETSNEGQLSTTELAGLRLLVAEDNRVNRLLIQKYLKGTALELEFAHDGAEAVDKVEQFKPDIVLMDVSMPVMDGLEATGIIRSREGPQPVIIALTANAFDTDRIACLEAGMNEFVTKPINRNRLLEVLASHCDPLIRKRRA